MRVALLCDGPYLPNGEGAAQRFVNTARLLAGGGHDVTVIHAYRGWSDWRQMAAEPYRTILVHPDDYYGATPALRSVLERQRFDWVQTKDPEMVASLLAGAALPASTGLIFECHDARPPGRDTWHEHWAARVADRVVTLTEADRDLLGRTTGRQDITVINGGVDPGAMRPIAHAGSGTRVAFLGNFFYPPNAQAAEYICREVLPELRARVPDAEVHFFGATPDGLAEQNAPPGAVWRGFSDNLRDDLASCDVALSAVVSGTGFRMKVLSYVEAGLPIVANPLGVAGIGPDSSFALGENAADLAALCSAYLADPDLRADAAQRQRRHVSRALLPADALGRYSVLLGGGRDGARRPQSGEWQRMAGRQPQWLGELVDQGRHPALSDARVRRGEHLDLRRTTAPWRLAHRERSHGRRLEKDGFVRLRRGHEREGRSMKEAGVAALTAGLAARLQRDPVATLAVGAATVDVVSDSAPSVAMMRHFYADTTRQGGSHYRVDVAVDARLVAQAAAVAGNREPDRTVRRHMDYTFDEWRLGTAWWLWMPSDRSYAIVRQGDRFNVLTADESVAVNWGTWLLREMSLRSLENRGGLALRAAAVGIDGEAVVLAGAKATGKSTLAAALLEAGGVQPLENGIVVLVPGAGGRIVAHGVPMPYRFADGTINASPALRDAVERPGASLLGRDPGDGKFEFTPREVADLFGTRRAGAMPVRAIVLPERIASGRGSLRRVRNLSAKHLTPQQTYPDDYLHLRNDAEPLTAHQLRAAAPAWRARWRDGSAAETARRILEKFSAARGEIT